MEETKDNNFLFQNQTEVQILLKLITTKGASVKNKPVTRLYSHGETVIKF